jgi:hypothetical protein
MDTPYRVSAEKLDRETLDIASVCGRADSSAAGTNPLPRAAGILLRGHFIRRSARQQISCVRSSVGVATVIFAQAIS